MDMKELIAAAEGGHADMQLTLGCCYQDGLDLDDNPFEKNLEKAVFWYVKAALQGNDDARKFYDGIMFDEEGFSDEESFSFSSRATILNFDPENLDEVIKNAEAGDAEAQNFLAERYTFGDGVPQDSVKMAEWYEKAAVQGLSSAQERLSSCYNYGDGVERDMFKAWYWLHKSKENDERN